MADNQTTATTQSALNIPEETREQFPNLIPLIEASPSVNDEERQYWIDVLPIMTEDQLANLKEILSTEKKQINEVNQNYSKGVKKEADKVKLAFDEEAYKAKKEARLKAEKSVEAQEKNEEEAVLKEIESMDF